MRYNKHHIITKILMIKCDQLPGATLKAINSPRLSEGYNVYSVAKSI